MVNSWLFSTMANLPLVSWTVPAKMPLMVSPSPAARNGPGLLVVSSNPLRRVPTMVLENGEVLIESMAILDHLDEQAGPDRRLLPGAGADRRTALKTCAFATRLCDNMVSLVHERVLHEQTSDVWIARCTAQVSGVLTALEASCAALMTPFWFGERPGHADIAVAQRFDPPGR